MKTIGFLVILATILRVELYAQGGFVKRPLRYVMIESVTFSQTPLDEALDALREKAQVSSQGEVKLNFVFPKGKPDRTVTLDLHHVPLDQVLKYFGEVLDLTPKIEASAIVFTPTVAGGTALSNGKPHPTPAAPTEAAALPKAEKKRSAYAAIPQDTLVHFISAITLGWRGAESHSKKSESQMQALFRDPSGRYADEFFKAAEDVNRIFGYPKLVPQLSTKEISKDQAILLFVGPKVEGRKVLREAGHRTNPTSEPWDGWFWWDESKEMSKGVIAIFQDEVTDHSLRFYLRRSLLTALGYPGYTDKMQSIFDSYLTRYPVGVPKPDAATDPFISDFDAAVVRFCDRFLATDASRADVRKVVTREWPRFAAQQDAAAVGAQPPK